MRRANHFGQGKEIGSARDTTYRVFGSEANTSRTLAEIGTAILQSARLTSCAPCNGIPANNT